MASSGSGGHREICTSLCGDVRGSGVRHTAFTGDELQTEVEACVEGFRSATDWGITSLLVDSDSKMLVDALNSYKFDLAPVGVIIKDACVFIRLNFTRVVISHCRRTCNNLAHAQVAGGASGMYSDRSLWPESAPDVVSVKVTSDLAEHRN